MYETIKMYTQLTNILNKPVNSNQTGESKNFGVYKNTQGCRDISYKDYSALHLNKATRPFCLIIYFLTQHHVLEVIFIVLQVF